MRKATFKKQQILQNVQMDTQTTFMNNGDINIHVCPWESEEVMAYFNSRKEETVW